VSDPVSGAIGAAARPGVVDYAMLLALASAWGLAFFFIKVAVETASPVTINLGRLGVSALVLYLLTRKLGLTIPPLGPVWGYLASVAILGNAVPYWLIAVSEEQVDSGLASILIGATPLVTMLMAHLATRDERMTPARIGGLCLGFAGLAVLLGPQVTGGIGEDLLAHSLLLAAAVSFAVNALVARRMPSLPAISAAFCMSLCGAVILFPFAVASDAGLSTQPGWAATASIVGLGVISTAGASVLFFTIVRRVGATFVTSANYLTPPVAVLLGAAVLGERPDINTFIAFALICTGIWLAYRSRIFQEKAK
jgi:drug/metabolite transporter (DMT)-like permease